MRHRRPPSIDRIFAPIFLTALLLASSPAVAQTPQNAPSEAGADQLRQFLDDTTSLQATFHQELLGSDGEVIELASGALSIKRPGRFLWRYAEPVEQLVIADGTNLWIYDVELEQATVTLLEDVAAASPAMLLSGEAVLDEEFDVIESFDADDLRWVRLEPKTRASDFRQVLIGFRGEALSQLLLLDSLDQRTTIELVDLEVNLDLADSVFEFRPPSGVDVIGEAG
ncbi:MAG: outer membrane lipoprotein chaperone LolA [Gammaproteobacteria bacterium]|nr:outer membrane lipoprotein chaperone LolA [Gammaproteobacteria bacterium]